MDTSKMLEFKSSVTKQSCKPKKPVKSPLGKHIRRKAGASTTRCDVPDMEKMLSTRLGNAQGFREQDTTLIQFY